MERPSQFGDKFGNKQIQTNNRVTLSLCKQALNIDIKRCHVLLLCMLAKDRHFLGDVLPGHDSVSLLCAKRVLLLVENFNILRRSVDGALERLSLTFTANSKRQK